MKKWIVFMAVLAITVCLFQLPVAATAEQERTGVALDWSEYNEVAFPDGYYYSEKKLEKMPTTLQAWVNIPQSVYGEPVGIVIGNERNNSEHAFVLRIVANGVPELTFHHREGDVYGRSYTFSKAVIQPDTWTHLTVVYGGGADGKEVLCYLDGQLKESFPSNHWYEPGESVLDNYLCLAGSFKSHNVNAFHGILGDIAVYGDARTAEEIQQDVAQKPDLQDADLMLSYELFDTEQGADVPDMSGHGYDMKYGRMWLSEEQMQEIWAEDTQEYAYSIAFLPDIQHSTNYFPEKLEPIFDYLIENAESENIQYVIGLGDMTDNNEIPEWEIVKTQMDRLNGKLPYALVRGNHDVLYNNDDNTLLHDDYFSTPDSYYYQHVKENGGFYEENTTINTYLLFSVGKVDYLLINLDFGAHDGVLEWAGTVLEEHSDRRAIIATHAYLNGDGNHLVGSDVIAPSLYSPIWNDGDDLWEKLVRKYANIDMVICGHVGVDNILCTTMIGDNGNEVQQVLMNTQGSDYLMGGLGFVGMMYFTEDGRFAKAAYYSTVRNEYFHETNADILMDFGTGPQTTNWWLIGAVVGAICVSAAIAVVIVCKKKRTGKSNSGE